MSILSIIPSLVSLGSELIEDPDKKNEFAFKVAELEIQLQSKMLDTKTSPKVDALVKLAYAGEAIVKGLLRPVGSACMFIFAAYCEVNAVELSEGIQMLLYGSPAAWGVSRHIDKAKAKKKPLKEEAEDDEEW